MFGGGAESAELRPGDMVVVPEKIYSFSTKLQIHRRSLASSRVRRSLSLPHTRLISGDDRMPVDFSGVNECEFSACDLVILMRGFALGNGGCVMPSSTVSQKTDPSARMVPRPTGGGANHQGPSEPVQAAEPAIPRTDCFRHC